MKKVVALLLCLAMLLGCAALAETDEKVFTGELNVNGKFTAKWVAPVGYHAAEVQSGDEGFMIVTFSPDEEGTGKPMMTISAYPDELLCEVNRLNDLDDAALAKIEDTFRPEDEVEISYMETTHGTKLMVVKEVKNGVDYVDFYTIYMGYEIEMVLTQTEEMAGTPITDEQIAEVVQFLSDLEFVPAE